MNRLVQVEVCPAHRRVRLCCLVLSHHHGFHVGAAQRTARLLGARIERSVHPPRRQRFLT
jgi:hypothetical protein